MNLAIGNLIDATGSDASALPRVVGLSRDIRGTVTKVALVNSAADVMPDVLIAERVSEFINRGDWVLRGKEQEMEFDIIQRHIRNLDSSLRASSTVPTTVPPESFVLRWEGARWPDQSYRSLLPL